MLVALASVSPMIVVFETAVKSVQDDVMAMVAVALPVGLAIFGTFMAIKFGKKFFKSVSN